MTQQDASHTGPMDSSRREIRWGILGPGGIARRFVAAFREVAGGRVVAVAGRSPERAQAFAKDVGLEDVAPDADALLDPTRIDAVYIATPHSAHAEAARMALSRGIAVLCEKPLTVHARQATELVDLSQERRVLLMEAMWTRHLPAAIQALRWLQEGRIGRPQLMIAQFGRRLRDVGPEHRLRNLKLAGGALLDMGVYNFAIADLFMGVEPAALDARGSLGDTGVDEHTMVMADYGNGCILQSANSFRTDLSNNFVIYGEDGRITMDPAFWGCTSVRVEAGDTSAEMSFPHRVNGFEYQVDAAHAALASGQVESPAVPHAATLRVMRTLDAVRRQIGLVYPFD